jgi:hypothetical protein
MEMLEYEISEIELDQEETDDLKQASFVEKVLTPMLKIYVPSGIADLSKVYLRHLEIMGEHPADFTSDKMLQQVMGQWSQLNSGNLIPPQQAQVTGQDTGAGLSQTGNQNQSMQGIMAGGTGNQGGIALPFGSQQAQPIDATMASSATA